VFLAVKSVSIDVPEGGLVALLGANGAGKSTTLKSISGLLKPERGEVTRGEISFAGRDLLALNAPERVRGGIAHCAGRAARVRAIDAGGKPPRRDLDALRSRARAPPDGSHLHVVPRLAERAKAKAGYLSGGEQQMLAIGRALMTEPKLLMLDEPSLGLAPFLVDEIFDLIRRINREAGIAMLLVEQNAAAALEIAEQAYLIENGRVVMNGTAAVVKANPDVEAAYLGGSHNVDYRAVKHYRRRKRWLA